MGYWYKSYSLSLGFISGFKFFFTLSKKKKKNFNASQSEVRTHYLKVARVFQKLACFIIYIYIYIYIYVYITETFETLTIFYVSIILKKKNKKKRNCTFLNLDTFSSSFPHL